MLFSVKFRPSKMVLYKELAKCCKQAKLCYSVRVFKWCDLYLMAIWPRPVVYGIRCFTSSGHILIYFNQLWCIKNPVCVISVKRQSWLTNRNSQDELYNTKLVDITSRKYTIKQVVLIVLTHVRETLQLKLGKMCQIMWNQNRLALQVYL